ncbi:hypothetical protein WMY93_011423 [Mugilogobius chulae]|uniref:PiggyBac transposable element-derived protein domain-containing protein n=1 Tax=Mugilogobius chulae TaxID=88201 RepID=A0AAW0P608_9GOBI
MGVDSSAESDSESEAEDVQPPPKRSRTTSVSGANIRPTDNTQDAQPSSSVQRLSGGSASGDSVQAASQPPATTRERSHPPLPSIDAQHERERGKDGTIWTLVNGEERGRRQSQNVLTEAEGPTTYARRRVQDPLTSFMCLMDADTLEHIRACTVSEAHRVLGNTSWQMEVDELLAFIALVYVRGAKGGRTLELSSFWSADWGLPYFKETMARNRFQAIMRFLRLDQKETRNARLESNKFALAIIASSATKPGPDITIDEQLLPTKARCPFTQYMANKPDKFGIKFWVAADVNTKYMLNAAPYLGKDVTRTPGQRLGDSVVLKLAEPFTGKVLKSAHATLTIYQGKAKTNVSILSTVHSSAGTLSGPKAKPEPVVYYNRTKVGVDVLDQMLRMYSVKAATRRWPVAVFYNILDMAAVNAWILYKKCMGSKISRRDFIFELANALRANHMSAKERPAVPVPVSVAFEQGADLERRRPMSGAEKLLQKPLQRRLCSL